MTTLLCISMECHSCLICTSLHIWCANVYIRCPYISLFTYCSKLQIIINLWLKLSWTLCLLVATFVICWWPLQTVWIRIRPDKMSGLIWIQTVQHSDGFPEIYFGKKLILNKQISELPKISWRILAAILKILKVYIKQLKKVLITLKKDSGKIRNIYTDTQKETLQKSFVMYCMWQHKLRMTRILSKAFGLF